MGNTPAMMYTMTAADGITVADTMTTDKRCTTCNPDFYSCATTRRPYSVSRRACVPSQCASKAAAVGREAVTDAADVTKDLWRVPTRLCSRS